MKRAAMTYREIGVMLLEGTVFLLTMVGWMAVVYMVGALVGAI